MKKQRPEVFFSILILVVGMILLLITPAGANFDEETYVARIWEMALGHVIPNSYLDSPERLPSGFFTISYRRNINLPATDIETLNQQLKVKIDDYDLMTYQTRAKYFPTLFLVQAVVMRFFGPHLHYPILILYYLLRFSYLIIYCLLIFFSIKVLPFGKWVFGTLAVFPMCLIQAAAVSADSLIIGISFLFIAWVIRIATSEKEALSKKELIVVCLLILALGTLKPNAVFLLPFLIIIPVRLLKNNKAWIPILIATVASVSIPVIWSQLAPELTENPGIDPARQLVILITNPHIFFKSLWVMLSSSLPNYLKQIVGVAGYGYWNMPRIIYWLIPAALVLALFSESAKVTLSTRQRILTGIIALFNLFMVFLVFYVVITPVGVTRIDGIQGRYFEPFLPLFIIPFMFTAKKHLNTLILGAILSICSLICAASLFLSYHVVCGYALATNQPCTLPYYKNWDPSTFLGIDLDNETEIKQGAVITCKELTGIQVWVNKNNTSTGQREFFALETTSGKTLRESWIQSESLPQNGWATIAIDPPLSSLNVELQFELNPKDGIGIPGLELGRFPTSEFKRGSLWLNGKETENDLVFKYICADDFSTILK
ncbi:MAG TPA: hypothetical protein DIW44_04510 [Anaerolineaceae bacterium]|nr:hypothetical protein [Anaerolineaceae bacterium]